MTSNETINEYWNSTFTNSDKQLFQKCCRSLLKKTFIVRDKDEENRKMYYFTSKNQDFFCSYFKFIGFEVVVSKDSGVIMLSNLVTENNSSVITVNRFRLKKIESIILCCLWTLLSDRLHRGSLDKVITITLIDLNIELEKYDFNDKLEKGRLDSILKLFTQFNLIGTNGIIGEDDFTILLYPSLQFALSDNEFIDFVKTANNKMQGKEDSVQNDPLTDDPFDIDFDSDNAEETEE